MFVRRSVGLMVAVLILVLGISGAAWAQSFPDVDDSHPYAEAIRVMVESGAVDGYANGNFGPDDFVLRQQFAKMVAGALEYSAFDLMVPAYVDVSPVNIGPNYYPNLHIALCYMAKVMFGKDETHFAPYENITRQQVVTVAYRAARDLYEEVPDSWKGKFNASDPTHGGSIRVLEYNGLLEGIEFADMTQPATRGECAQILSSLRAFVQAAGWLN